MTNPLYTILMGISIALVFMSIYTTATAPQEVIPPDQVPLWFLKVLVYGVTSTGCMLWAQVVK